MSEASIPLLTPPCPQPPGCTAGLDPCGRSSENTPAITDHNLFIIPPNSRETLREQRTRKMARKEYPDYIHRFRRHVPFDQKTIYHAQALRGSGRRRGGGVEVGRRVVLVAAVPSARGMRERA